MATMGSCNPSKQEVFDIIRGRWVIATPEEKVRQTFVRHMVHRLGFPKGALVIEQELSSMPHVQGISLPERRVDIVCFAQKIHPHHLFYPLLLVECKGVETSKPLEQLMGYNAHVQAYYIATVTPTSIQVGFLEAPGGRYQFYPSLPSYAELMTSVKHG